MSKIGKLAIIANKMQWLKYQDELKTELAKKQNTTAVTLDFPSDPKQYPCLAATTFARPGPIYHGELSTSHIVCCFIYVEDAEALIKARELTREALELQPKSKEIKEKTKSTGTPVPLSILVAVLALASELKSIGAIKQERFEAAMDKVNKWLTQNSMVSKNSAFNFVDLLNSLLKSDLSND